MGRDNIIIILSVFFVMVFVLVLLSPDIAMRLTGYHVSEDLECEADWHCSSWSDCTNGQKIRSCTDITECEEPKLEVEDC